MKLHNRLILLAVWLLPILLLAATPQKQTYTYTSRDSQTLQLDLYSAYTGEAQPCLMFVFGGGFKEGTRDSKTYSDYFNYFADKGFTVVSIDYRLGMKDEKAPSMLNYKPMQNAIELAVEDLYTATNYLLKNAHELNIDTTQIIISGSSAGAIAVLQADYEKRNSFESADILPLEFQYAGVIAFSGSIFSREGAPSYEITPAPTLLFHGSADKLVPYNNSRFFRIGMFGSNTLAKEFRKNEYPYLFYSMEDNGHEVAEYPMKDFLPEIEQFITDYVFDKKQLLIDINYRDKNRVPEKSDSPSDYYNK